MASYEHYAETLVKLGLSRNEARVYLGTLKIKKATAKVISKNTGVGREDVYRILPSLLELGLIKKHISSPAQYEAIDPVEATKMLLTSRDQESEHIRRQSDEFLELYSKTGAVSDVFDEKTVVVSRDNSSGVDAELMRLIRKTKNTLDFTTRYKLFSTAFNEKGLTEWIDEMYYAAERGVKFRMIIDHHQTFRPWMSEIKFSIKNSNRLLTHPNFDFRYVPTPPECIMILFDNQSSCIETSCQKPTKMSPYMITSNPVFAALNKAYFGLLWNEGLTEKQCEQANTKLIRQWAAKTRIKRVTVDI